METVTIFLNENQKRDEIYDLINVERSRIKKYIDIIASKASNNKIGYFQFLYENTYYKFYIMPKIYRVVNTSEDKKNYKDEEQCEGEDCIQKFIQFFKHYYRLRAKYSEIGYSDTLEGNISDFSYNSEEKAKELSSDDFNIDDFIVRNYDDSLDTIEKFFIKHKQETYREEKVQSHSIQYKPDIKRNIVEPNKSNVHQIKRVSMRYSDIAIIVIEVIKYFLTIKIKNFSATDKSEALRIRADRLQKSIKKKFSKKSNFTFKIQLLTSPKIANKFNKDKNIYKALLKLAAKEHYYKNNVYREIDKMDDMVSLFFQPDKLYEWILYDELVTTKKFEYDEVLKDKKENQKNIVKKYSLLPTLNTTKHKSEPDLIVIKNNKEYPVDAKWKILNKKSAEFDNDIAKLRRDAKIRGVNKGYLIFPKQTKTSKFKLETEYYYDFDEDFKFEVMVINVDNQ